MGAMAQLERDRRLHADATSQFWLFRRSRGPTATSPANLFLALAIRLERVPVATSPRTASSAARGVFLRRAPLAQLLALPVDADADVGVDFTN
jgi:hypothetical protein